jgi:uncharacterized protein YutE (UPF0331/DUF86 family)
MPTVVDVERLARLLRRVTDDVRRLQDVVARGEDPRGDVVLLDHVKYRFVTAIEAAMDAAHHICATEGFAPPSTNAEAMRELARHDLLPAAIAEGMARAVGFRNVLVHRYAEVDDGLVVEQLSQLGTLGAFVEALTATYL